VAPLCQGNAAPDLRNVTALFLADRIMWCLETMMCREISLWNRSSDGYIHSSWWYITRPLDSCNTLQSV